MPSMEARWTVLCFFFLMAAAIVVLRRRHVDWPRAFVDNKWIWLYFAFGLVSVLWSAEPMMSFRRVPKAAGNVLMAMVILTEPRPSYALAGVLRRLAYLTLPLSVVFNRYFPQLSRRVLEPCWQPDVFGCRNPEELTG